MEEPDYVQDIDRNSILWIYSTINSCVYICGSLSSPPQDRSIITLTNTDIDSLLYQQVKYGLQKTLVCKELIIY